MRAIDCECGHRLEAADIEELVEETRSHIVAVHPEMHVGEDEIRALLEEKSYDTTAVH
jgi:predicted small metal-binding protein